MYLLTWSLPIWNILADFLENWAKRERLCLNFTSAPSKRSFPSVTNHIERTQQGVPNYHPVVCRWHSPQYKYHNLVLLFSWKKCSKINVKDLITMSPWWRTHPTFFPFVRLPYLASFWRVCNAVQPVMICTNGSNASVADPGFLRGANPRGSDNLLLGIIYAENCMKMKKIGLTGGARDAHP